MIVYGTAWKEDATEGLVRQALDAGFTAFDTANQRKHYHEAGVGAGLADALAARGRDALWIQTKFTFQAGQDHRLPYDPRSDVGDQVRQSFASSLAHLGVDRIDSLLLHGPSQRPGLGAPDHAAWRAMEGLLDAGRVAAIGISNVTAEQLDALLAFARQPVSAVQNRCYARTGWDADVRSRCAANGIAYQGFSLLTANREVWNHRNVAEIARGRGWTPAQVIFARARELGIHPLTGSSDARHLAADLAVAGPAAAPEPFTPDERALLAAAGGGSPSLTPR